MKRPLVPHLLYALLTIATFVTGWYWSRSAGRYANGDTGRDSSRGGESSSISALTPKPTLAKRRLGAAEGASSESGIQAFGDGRAVPSLQQILTASKDGPLSESQLQALVYLATKSRDPVERRKAFDRLLEEMGAEEFTVEQAMVLRGALFESGADGEQWRLFDYAWGANHPAAALAFLDEIPVQYRRGYTGNMLPGLASVDPQAAIDLVAGMEGTLRQQMTGRLLEGLVDRDPALAADYVKGLAENGDPNARKYMAHVANEVLRSAGFARSLDWAERMPDGPLKSAALMPIANAYTKRDPIAAATWAEQYIGTEHSRIFGEVVRQWSDLKAAAAWVDTLPAGREQQVAISAIYGFRGAKEPQVAVQEILGMAASKNRDYAINGFISGLAHRDGEAAAIWAGEIAEPQMRAAAQIRAGRQFYKQDKRGALVWFSNSGLPESAWAKVTADAG